MVKLNLNSKYYSHVVIVILLLFIFPKISYGQSDKPSAAETAEWIRLMLNNRCSVNEDFEHLECCIQVNSLSAKKLYVGLSNLGIKSGRTIVKNAYEVEFGLLDPDNIEVTPTKITLKTTNGIKSIKRTQYNYDLSDHSLKEIVQLDNVNLIEIQINGKNLYQLLDKTEWIDISRVKNAFENIIRKNGGKKSTIEWKSDEELKKEKNEEVKKRF